MLNNTIIGKYRKSNNVLSDLMKKYGSDKGSPIDGDTFSQYRKMHLYTDLYNLIFSGQRQSVNRVFECGIGTANPEYNSTMGVNAVPGASLRAWKDYFPNATIYGADIDKNSLFEDERIKTFYVDQLDPQSVYKMWNEINEPNESFDLIIDDGLHTVDAAISLLENSFHKLKSGGTYIIEDTRDFWQNLKKHLDRKRYTYMMFDMSNDFSYCFIILK